MMLVQEKKKILVVDDQPENIHILIENLESEYEVLFATTGQKAIEIARSANRPDLILLDIMMPDLNGYEVCRQIKAREATEEIPIIFVTSQTGETDEAVGFSLGAADYITKPFRLPVVKMRIQSVLRLQDEMNRRQQLADQLEDLNKTLEDRIERKIRALRNAHEQLKISELKYRTIYENALEGVFQTSLDGKILDVTPSCAAMLGYDSPESLIEQNPLASSLYCDADDRESWVEKLKKEREVSAVETRFKRKDGGYIWALLSASAVRNLQGEVTHYQGFWVDITQQKRAYELELANIRLRELDSLKSSLMSTASHDMRSPMSAILGYNSLIKNKFSEHFLPIAHMNEELGTIAEKMVERFDIIESEGRRLIRMVNDFLDLSKFESGCTEWNDKPVQLNDIGRQALKVMRGLNKTNENVQLEACFAPDLPVLSCDPDRIMQVMVNLLGNATKFTRSGSIRVRTLKTPENHVEVQVEDTGPGIPEDQRDKIFRKFHQVQMEEDAMQKIPKGTGLGLAICKQIVEHYEGNIWVNSQHGEGSTFVFRLPVNRGMVMLTTDAV
jgi:PAS domain S-box-containing protein